MIHSLKPVVPPLASAAVGAGAETCGETTPSRRGPATFGDNEADAKAETEPAAGKTDVESAETDANQDGITRAYDCP